MQAKKKLIVIVGPTASGKTRVAIEVARHFKTVVISADSRQIFREMSIGTAKPNAVELATVPHHFINTHSIYESYDAATYGADALNLIRELFQHHDQLVVCGGSGLYIKALCEGFDDIPPVDAHVREQLKEDFEVNGISSLQQKLLQLDPDHYKNIDSKNPHRLMRALEVTLATGLSITTFHNKQKLQHNFDIVKIGLELSRDAINLRIEKRMDKMIAAGLFDEAASLYEFKHLNALQTVGYQEIFEMLDGAYDKTEAIRLLKRNTRRYAKRQMTWFKRDREIIWVDPVNIDKIIATAT